MYFQKIAVPLLKNEACPSYGHSKLVHTSKIWPNLEILNGCNSETIQVQGLKFHANSSLRVRYVLTKFRQNLWRVSIFRVDLTWNDLYYITNSYTGMWPTRAQNKHKGFVWVVDRQATSKTPTQEFVQKITWETSSLEHIPHARLASADFYADIDL